MARPFHESSRDPPVMAKHTERVRIEEVDWPAVFPWLSLTGALRAALHPGKLFTALLLVVLLMLAGNALDLILGPRVHRGEIAQYRQVYFGRQTPEQFDEWKASRLPAERAALKALLRETPRFKGGLPVINAIDEDDRPHQRARQALVEHYAQAFADNELDRKQIPIEGEWERVQAELRIQRRLRLARVDALTPRGAFEAGADAAGEACDRLLRAAATFNVGWSDLVSGEPRDAGDNPPSNTVVAALRDLVIILPAWLWDQHRTFLILFLLIALIVTSLLGGAITRMAALHATRDERIGLRPAVRFVVARWWSFLLVPVAPLAVIAIVAALMGAGGFILFSLEAWGIDIIAAILFIAAILCGFIIAAAILLTAAGVHLAYPAIAVDGADVFDALARAFNYVLNRPWRWLFYSALSLLIGALGYLLLLLLLLLTFWAVRQFVGMWVFSETALGDNRFDTMLPAPSPDGMSYDVDSAALDWSGRIAAWIMRAWMCLTASVLAAFAISYYFAANTWIYLLLRRSADGVEVEDVTEAPAALEPGPQG